MMMARRGLFPPVLLLLPPLLLRFCATDECACVASGVTT